MPFTLIKKNMNYKKIISFCIFNIFLFCCFSKELTVMSFNIQGHGPGSSEHRMGKEKWEKQIVSTIEQSGAVLILLQEVPLYNVPNNLAQSLVDKLNKGNSYWKYETSVSYSLSSMDLNNAIIYNTKYLSLKNDLAKKPPFNLAAFKFDQENDNRKFKFIKNNEQILEFSFNEKPNQNFYVINVHLPGPDEGEKIKQEREQLELLYALYKRKVPIIIAGDFNLSRKELLRGSNFSDAIIDGSTERYSDFWGQKTTVTEDISSLTLKNDFDHFIISKNQLFTVSEQMHHVFSKDKKENYDKIKIGSVSYKNSFEYHRGLSDHIPIMIKLKF